MAKKKAVKKKVRDHPTVFEMFKLKMIREGKLVEYKQRYKTHRSFGMTHAQAMWATVKDFGFTSQKDEIEQWRKHDTMGSASYNSEQRRKASDEEQLETELRELMELSDGKKFDAVTGLEWVASNFHHKFVTPGECPHIIAWNVLQTSRKYEVAFFKDFLMKALQKGVTVESTEKYAEDDSQLDELRAAVGEAIKGK